MMSHKAAPFIHESAFVDDNVSVGAGTKVWHFVHLLPGTNIGEDCSLGQNVMVGPDVTVGDRCKIQNNVALYKGVHLEDGVFCGPSCVFTNVLVPRAEVERKDEFAPTIVRRGATIGANATIVCGNELGAYCMVAAGAVVTANVKPYALMAGVPARQMGWVSRSGDRLGKDLVCPRTGEHYVEENGQLSLMEQD
ncbi:MAG: acyltransferase [Parasphingorhabdus sp.]|nr:acyltransferase [Parasphingorhabdus sp.]